MQRRHARWISQWGTFFVGVVIGLLLITPVLAAPLSPASGLDPDTVHDLVMLGWSLVLIVLLVLAALVSLPSNRPQPQRIHEKVRSIGKLK